MGSQRKADIVLGQRLSGGAGGDDVLELGKLPPSVERRVVVETVEHRSHPPGKALRFPDAAKTDLRVSVLGFHGYAAVAAVRTVERV